MKQYTTTELLRSAIDKPQLFNELPKEGFNEIENYLIDQFKAQRQQTDKPTLKSVLRHIQSIEERADVIKSIQDLALGITKIEPLDNAEWDLALNEVLIDARNYIFRKIFELLQTNADEKSIQQLQRRLAKINDVQSNNRYSNPISATDYDKLQEYEVEELSSTIEWLNSNNVKFRKKDLYSLIAHTNGGKTVVSTWIALQLAKAGNSVLYLAQEESRTDTLRRVYQACLGLTKQQYIDMSKERLEYLFNNYISMEGFGRFDVAEWPGIKVDELMNKVDDIEEEAEIKYDAVFIDYSRHISSSRKSNANWEAIGQVFEELKNWAMLSNRVVFTAVQLNRESSAKFINRQEGVSAPLMDVTDVAGAYEATHWCQYILGVSFDPADSKPQAEAKPSDTKGTFRFQVVKQKHGDLGFGDVQPYRFLETMHLDHINLDATVDLPAGLTEEEALRDMPRH